MPQQSSILEPRRICRASMRRAALFARCNERFTI
jgi:hypothetical protein